MGSLMPMNTPRDSQQGIGGAEPQESPRQLTAAEIIAELRKASDARKYSRALDEAQRRRDGYAESFD